MKFISPEHYDQEYCTRCEKKCRPVELVSIVCRIPKSTHILLICEKCTISFCKWLSSSDDNLPTWKELTKSFTNSYSKDIKEDWR
tara:strand:+ start:100 stop:354 length:255 start_codon:yes stop_codon:yes gene_type:complete